MATGSHPRYFFRDPRIRSGVHPLLHDRGGGARREVACRGGVGSSPLGMTNAVGLHPGVDEPQAHEPRFRSGSTPSPFLFLEIFTLSLTIEDPLFRAWYHRPFLEGTASGHREAEERVCDLGGYLSATADRAARWAFTPRAWRACRRAPVWRRSRIASRVLYRLLGTPCRLHLLHAGGACVLLVSGERLVARQRDQLRKNPQSPPATGSRHGFSTRRSPCGAGR
jgi:hypothetical protein